MRAVAAAAAVVLLAGAASLTAGERSGGVITFVDSGGVTRSVTLPVRESLAVPEGETARRNALWPAVQATARKHGVDPDLVDLVIRMESGYNPRAVSPMGARGLMQLLPSTASLYGVENVFDARENLIGGVRYLRDLLTRFRDDVKLALAAYNAGPEAVERHNGVPPYSETRDYVRSILAAYHGAGTVKLSGGFGRPARPVELVGGEGGALISNSRRNGEAVVTHHLTLH
jgi:soluble lytic murein transglycosylase-like protein